MNHSTGKPTAIEAAYIEACKSWECAACAMRESNGDAPPFFVAVIGCDFHHFKSGNVRIGHLWGIGLCAWHHRGVPLEGWTPKAMRSHFGPSLMDGSRTFHVEYGDDASLLAIQDEVLKTYGVTPPERPENRRWQVAA